MFHRGRFVLIPLVMSSLTALADDPQRFDVSQAWFKPELQINNRPEVCEPIFRTYFNYFVSPGASNPVQPISSRGSGDHKPGALTESIQEISWTELGDRGGGEEVLRLAEWRQGDKYFGMLEHGRAIGWRPHTYQYFLLDKPPSEAVAIDANGSYGDGSLGLLDKSAKSGVYEVIYPSDPRYRNYREHIGIQVANVYTFGRDVYLALVGHTEGELRQPVYFVASVVSPRQLRLVCKFTTSPPSTALRSEVAKIPSFSDFEQVTRDIMGEGGDCGTMNAPARAMNDLREGLDALIVRPWAYSTDLESYGFPVWGYSGAWNYRKYSEFKTILPKTRQALADRYARNYRLPKSEALKLADAGITAALARGFSHGAAEDEYHELHRALLEGRPAAEIDRLLPAPDALKKTAYDDGLLAIAIGHPRLVELLLMRGYDPNETNAFGKTPLMYAAQFNDLESAKLLVKHGANVEFATTRPLDTCNYTVHTHGVTALHYAVRYASRDFIAWLVDTGAVTSVKDSSGYTALDYLTRFGGYVRYQLIAADGSYGQQNKLLTNPQIDSLAALLSPLGDEQRRQTVDEENRSAETLYRAGQVKEAYAAVKRALSLDAKDERALSSLSLIALKLGYHGESAKAASYLIKNASGESVRASAYFNLGLACEAAGSDRFHYTNITYDGATYCEERWDRYHGPLHYYLMAYQTAPTTSRANAITEFLGKIDNQHGKWLCKAHGSAANPRSVYVARNHIYLLAKTGTEISYPKLARRERNQDSALEVKAKEQFPLGNGLSVLRWEVSVPFQGTLILGNQLCSRFLPTLIDDGTELVEVYTRDERKPVSVSSSTSKPIVLVLYGNVTKWTITDDSRNIRAVYVHGRDSELQRAENSAAVVHMDTKQGAYSEPWGSSFNAYSATSIGLKVGAMVDATNRQQVRLDDAVLSSLPPCDSRPRSNCRSH